jgi:hypothetical protein
MKRFYFQETDYCSAVMRDGHGKARSADSALVEHQRLVHLL